jgi:hypothetical protein
MKYWMMVGVLAALGCGGGSGATCPTGNTLTYDNFGRPFMDRYCVRCHGASGRSPNLTTAAAVRSEATEIDGTSASGPSGTNTSMPQGTPAPTTAERTQLGQWLACGAP